MQLNVYSNVLELFGQEIFSGSGRSLEFGQQRIICSALTLTKHVLQLEEGLSCDQFSDIHHLVALGARVERVV